MGNSVAPAHMSASQPVNSALSSTAELDPSLIVASPSLLSPPQPSESKINNFTSDPSSPPPLSSSSSPATIIDVPPDLDHLDDLSPLQLLFYAAEHGNCDLIRKAVEQGVKVSAPDLGLKTQQAEKEAEAIASGKKKTKADLKAEKEKESLYKDFIITHDTALHKAVANGHLEAIELLFYLEADLEAKNVLGSTPLHRAISSKQTEAVKLLLSQGADLDAVTAIGNTPLHVAAYVGEVEIAQLILTAAKDHAYRLVVACNQAGLTPIDYARKKPIHQLLSSHRVAVSHTSSFVGAHNEASTPKVDGVSGVLALVQYGSGGQPPLLKKVSSERSSHASTHHHLHHHVPNPPLNINSHSSSSTRANTLHSLPQAVSVEPLTPSNDSKILLPPLPATPPLASLNTKPSFEKASSLDSHPTGEDEQSSLGSMVLSPLLAVGEGKGRVVNGAQLSSLSINMLPNECEMAEEEQMSVIQAVS